MDTVALVSKQKSNNGKIRWKSGPAIKQYFPFRNNLINYITMNPSSAKAYSKLIQSCKYFFDANPILVVSQMLEPVHWITYGKTKICLKEIHKDLCGFGDCCIEIDFNKLLSKIWLTTGINISGNINPNFTSILLQKLYRCDIVELYLYRTTIPFDNFTFLVQSVQRMFIFPDVKIIYDDGNTVLLDKILEVCPKIEKFCCDFSNSTDFSMLSPSTLKDISNLQNLTNLKNFEMYRLPEIFNDQDIFDFLLLSLMETNIYISFSLDISDGYKFQIRALSVICYVLREMQFNHHHVTHHLYAD